MKTNKVIPNRNEEQTAKTMSRRRAIKFLAKTSVAGVAGFSIVPSHLLGGEAAPSNKIIMAAIGTGSRGPADIGGLAGFADVQFVDLTVGRVMEQLRKLGLEENTLLLFSSDNGAYGGGNHDVEFFDSNGALRGYKRDLYEGGIRVPLIVRWPGRVAAGSTNDHISAMWDLFPTFCDVAGTGAPSGLDGISMLPTLLGRKEQKQHEALYWEFHEQGGSQAVRQGNWKAVRTHIKGRPPGQFELFNLATDPGEKQDVAGQQPEIARRLRELMTRSHQPHPSLNFKNP